MVNCPQCNSYRVESHLTLVSPKSGKALFRPTDFSLPILMIFIGVILYAAIDSLLLPYRVQNFIGWVLLGVFVLTVTGLLISYLIRDRFVEKLRYICAECHHHWIVDLPHVSHPGHSEEKH